MPADRSGYADAMTFIRMGSGPPLLLIHGIGHRWQAWEPVLGGAIALELAAANLAASVNAFSPAGFATRVQRRRALAILHALRATTFLPAPALRQGMRSRMLRALAFAPLIARPQHLDPQRLVDDALALRQAPGFRDVARALRTYRFVADVEVPVTIAWGERDHILRPSQAARARAGLPHARHVVLSGCGHVPMSDDPGLVTSTILTTTAADRSG